MNDQHLLSATAGLDEAREESRSHTTEYSPMGTATRRGIILGVNDNGTYTVGLLAAGAAPVETILNVPAWGATFGEGDRVAVVFDPARRVPWIQGGGGSGSGGAVVGIDIANRFFSS